ncbi:hypothetical protein QBC43DRAFT_37508 [Cladorrhinum sp. PSN259]|nr:hypothetical protein QBC43DRAFT_37508 [Cladorrhinum sp. PSN259]
MASQEIDTIERSAVKNLQVQGPIKITDCKQLASYSWWDTPNPTISVPGSPRRYSPPEFPFTVELDPGTQYCDVNAARHPSSPLEPLFRALYILNPDFSLSDVDLITDREDLHKLLRFAAGSSMSPFTIRVQVVSHAEGQKGTVFFTRVELDNDRVPDEESYTREYEKKCTIKPLDSMAEYHRIIGYTFGGLKCIVRSETSGYVAGEEGTGAWSLSDSMETTTTGLTILRPSTNQADADVSSALEIITRKSAQCLYFRRKVYPEMWFSQTSKLAVGYHNDNVFHSGGLRDESGQLSQWEADNQQSLARLVGLLKWIIDAARKAKGGRAKIKSNGKKSLSILAQPALPEDLHAKWRNKQPQPGEARVEDDERGLELKTPA